MELVMVRRFGEEELPFWLFLDNLPAMQMQHLQLIFLQATSFPCFNEPMQQHFRVDSRRPLEHWILGCMRVPLHQQGFPYQPCTWTPGSALRSSPRHVLVAPVSADHQVQQLFWGITLSCPKQRTISLFNDGKTWSYLLISERWGR